MQVLAGLENVSVRQLPVSLNKCIHKCVLGVIIRSVIVLKWNVFFSCDTTLVCVLICFGKWENITFWLNVNDEILRKRVPVRRGNKKETILTHYWTKTLHTSSSSQVWKHLPSKVLEILDELRAVQVCMSGCVTHIYAVYIWRANESIKKQLSSYFPVWWEAAANAVVPHTAACVKQNEEIILIGMSLLYVQVFLKSDDLCLITGRHLKMKPTLPPVHVLAMHVQQLEIGAFTLTTGAYKWSKLRWRTIQVSSQVSFCPKRMTLFRHTHRLHMRKFTN